MTLLFKRTLDHGRGGSPARTVAALAVVAWALGGCAGVSGTPAASSMPSSPDLVHVDYNSFTDTTKVRTVLMPLTGDLQLYAGFRYPGEVMRQSPAEAYIVFQETSSSPRWRNPLGRSLELELNDSTQVSYEETEYLSDTLHGDNRLTLKVVEWVWVTIPAEAFRQIAEARRVEGKLSRTSFVLDERHTGALRALARRMVADSTTP
ncbi:MAG: hypothetical protein ACREON_08095 [Gemmatimonadaceae bacterium]